MWMTLSKFYRNPKSLFNLLNWYASFVLFPYSCPSPFCLIISVIASHFHRSTFLEANKRLKNFFPSLFVGSIWASSYTKATIFGIVIIKSKSFINWSEYHAFFRSLIFHNWRNPYTCLEVSKSLCSLSYEFWFSTILSMML